jgi:hypothetical protein
MLDVVWPGSVPCVDLTTSSDFTLALLDDTLAWRHRMRKELEFGSGDHVRVTTRYHVQFPRLLLHDFVRSARAEWARVLLPLTTRNKAMLLRLRVHGPEGAPAHRLARKSSAAIQAEYLRRLALTSPAGDDVKSVMRSRLLEAICVFMPDMVKKLTNSDADGPVTLASYLTSGLGFDVAVDRVRRWWTPAKEAGQILTDALDEPPEPFSSSEMVLLALPRMDPLPRTLEEIDDLVERYLAGLRAARDAGDRSFLMALADYGRRYEIIVDTRVPLDEPATLALVEDRELHLSPAGWTMQEVTFGDARSSHIEAHTTDHTVQITQFDVRDVHDQPLAPAWIEGLHWTSEALQLYSSEPGRPYYIRLRLRFQAARSLQATGLMLAGITAVAAVIGLVTGEEQLISVLALLAVPTTLAAALALVRDQTALAARALARVRLVIEVAIGLLWVVVLVRTALSTADPGWFTR